MESEIFYSNVTSISDFKRVSDEKIYKPVPDDWWVVVGDIRNSTEAIDRGLYKEVNMAGATIIAAISNVHRDAGHLPYAFGGDGAFLLIPNKNLAEVQKALIFCRKAISESFNLDMRVGVVSMNEIRNAGYDIKVAKLKLSPSMNQALFWGDGFSYAENLIKEKDMPDEKTDYTANLEGLECRWQEIPPIDDEISSYIIKAKGKSDTEKSEIYSQCLQKIDEVYGSINERNPVQIHKLNLTKNWKKLQTEWKIRTWKPTLSRKLLYGIKLIFEAVVGDIFMKKKISTKKVKWGEYKSDAIAHVDFRKFDDGLRFVASGTIKEREAIESFLNKLLAEGKLNFGIHSSQSLIVTCYVTNHQKEHIHFVDGVDGGYAMAAKKMKKQVKESR